MKAQQTQVFQNATVLFLISSLFFLSCGKIALSDAPVTSTTLASESVATIAKDPVPLIPGLLVSSLQVHADPVVVTEGQKSHLTITFQNTDLVQYICKDRLTQAVLISGNIKNSGEVLALTVNQDIACEIHGIEVGTKRAILRSQDLTLACGNRIKNAAQNKCEDFSCQEVLELSSVSDLLSIPARDSRGLCYAIKLLEHINNSSSTLTTVFDSDVISRNHDGNVASRTNRNEHPYQMGAVNVPFKINGARVVKLAGGVSASSPILVDNFVLIGVHPTAADIRGQIASHYTIYGSSDSTLVDSQGTSSKNISVMGELIPLIPFATGGTSSIAPLDVTRQVEPNVTQTLDLRALDCGGARELSDIYLLFQ